MYTRTKIAMVAACLWVLPPAHADNTVEFDRSKELGNPPPSLGSSAKGWQDQQNWRQLEPRMSYDEVRSLLGEPDRVSAGCSSTWNYPSGGDVIAMRPTRCRESEEIAATWTYPNGGDVVFSGEGVIRWSEPFSLE